MNVIEFARMCIGGTLLGRHEEPLGVIDEVYVDADTEKIRWARVLEPGTEHKIYVPLLRPEKRLAGLLVGLDESAIRAAPRTSSADVLAETDEILLYDYYSRLDATLDAELPAVRPKHAYVVVAGKDDDSSLLTLGRVDDPAFRGRREGVATATGAKEKRFLHGRAPECVALGQVAALQVRLVIEPATGPNVALEPIEIPAEGADVVLVLHHPGFEAVAPARRTVHLPPDGPSDWALFEVRARREGVHDLIVSAFRGGAFLGELTFQLTAEAGLSAGQSVDVVEPVHSLSSSDGEVSLLINFDSDRQVYTFQFLSSDQADEGVPSSRLLTPPKGIVETLVADLNRLARGNSQLDGNKTRRWLQAKGVGLWQDLIPEAVRRQFWERRDRIASLTILSAGDLVPWELLYPLDASPDDDRGFLAEQFPVMRWVYGGAKIRELPVRGDAAFVMPEGSPTTARDEIAAVRTLLGAGDGLPIAGLDELLTRLEAANFGVMHFACHNTFDASGVERSTVRMAGGPFELAFLNPLKVRHTLREHAPLVFMNACRSAGTGEHYTQVTGWAQAFVQAGAGAFIGSLWEVRDSTASEFAEAFYAALLSTPKSGVRKVTLGEAVQTARAAVADRAGDPTWLAYTVYGSPGAVAA